MLVYLYEYYSPRSRALLHVRPRDPPGARVFEKVPGANVILIHIDASGSFGKILQAIGKSVNELARRNTGLHAF